MSELPEKWVAKYIRVLPLLFESLKTHFLRGIHHLQNYHLYVELVTACYFELVEKTLLFLGFPITIETCKENKHPS